jgi:hypothetical protein
MSTPSRVIKKGEFLFKEGDKIQHIQLIQQGAVSVCLSRPKKNIEFFTVGSSQVLGEQGLQGSATHPFSAIATTETKVVEIPVDAFKQVIEGAPQMMKVLVKSMIDRLKMVTTEVKSLKMEKDNSPCPDDQVAKVFGTIFHVFNHKGLKDAKDPNQASIDYVLCRQYSQRIFGESLKRLEQALNLLVKLKIASYEMGHPPEDPEGPEQIMKVHLHDLSSVESFFEFYQYYYFKNGRSEILKTDDSTGVLLNQFVTLAEGLEPDRFNVVTLDFSKTMERFKSDLAIELKPDHFTRLEQKGVFCKRQARQDGTVVLQFDIKEFRTTQKIWRILREVDKWNEKGFVDPNEEEAAPRKKAPEGAATCPQCANVLQPQAKFCSECGFKIAA